VLTVNSKEKELFQLPRSIFYFISAVERKVAAAVKTNKAQKSGQGR